ncbi:MAG: tetratricopeptide repeat-containing sulfotransferase family protein [Wenzhouxiangellaceae bacterium]
MLTDEAALHAARKEFRKRLSAEGGDPAIEWLDQAQSADLADLLAADWLLAEGDGGRARPRLQALVTRGGEGAWLGRSALALLDGDPATAAREAQQGDRQAGFQALAANHQGRALFNLGQIEAAGVCFRRAVESDALDPHAWHNLGHWLRATSKLTQAIDAYGRALALVETYRSARLNRGITQALLEQSAAALADFDALLARDPEDIEARLNAGIARHALGRLDEAEADFRRIVATHPDHAQAWTCLGVLLNERLQHEQAREALEKALALDPTDVDARRELANLHEKANRLDLAENVLAPMADRVRHDPGVAIDLARLKRRRGQVEDALSLLAAIDARRLPHRLAIEYHYELGRALDRAGRHGPAFEAFTQANRLAAASPRRAMIDPEAFPRELAGLRAWLERGAPGAPPSARDPDQGADLCFMIGFPRSGTTLLDTILNALSGVRTLDEQPTFEQARRVVEADGLSYWMRREPWTGAEVAAFRRRYREVVARRLGPGPSGRIVDKLPLRMIHAPLLAQVFPEARFVFSLRHPADVVLSNFMQHYAPNEAFVHFDTLAGTVRIYAAVMSLWPQILTKLEGRVRVVRYEQLVDRPEDELRALCDFIGVSFDPNALDPSRRLEDRERVRTNSYEQVAEPIYRRSVERWRHYAPALQRHYDELAPFLDLFGYRMAG